MRAQRSAAADLGGRGLGREVALLEQHRTRHHHRQRVVQLVRDAGQQRAERRELLALERQLALARQLRLRALALSDVGGDAAHAVGGAIRVVRGNS